MRPNPKSLIACAVAVLPCFGAPAKADEPFTYGYLRAVYSWQIPMFPNCGTPADFSTEVPFFIDGNRIMNPYKVAPPVDTLDIEQIPPQDSDALPDINWEDTAERAPVINYSYRCGVCSVSGSVWIENIGGKVITFAGEKMLQFSVFFHDQSCKITCPGLPVIDCSYVETVEDQFTTPLEDGYVVDRPRNMIFKYLLRLKSI